MARHPCRPQARSALGRPDEPDADERRRERDEPKRSTVYGRPLEPRPSDEDLELSKQVGEWAEVVDQGNAARSEDAAELADIDCDPPVERPQQRLSDAAIDRCPYEAGPLVNRAEEASDMATCGHDERREPEGKSDEAR